MRQCGNCTLCCRLLPVSDGVLINGHRKPGFYFHKPAGVRCKHQRHTGCNIYAQRPFGCRAWSCLWLIDQEQTPKLSRPDRSHYVIDIARDVIDVTDNDTGQIIHIAVMQVWCDPQHRDAWKDPELIELIERQGREGSATLIRYDSKDGFVVFPGSMTGGEMRVVRSDMTLPERTTAETVALLEGLQR